MRARLVVDFSEESLHCGGDLEVQSFEITRVDVDSETLNSHRSLSIQSGEISIFMVESVDKSASEEEAIQSQDTFDMISTTESAYAYLFDVKYDLNVKFNLIILKQFLMILFVTGNETQGNSESTCN